MANQPDFKYLLASIQRVHASYISDDAAARAAFAELGCTVLGRFSDDETQAIASIAPDGVQTLTITGSRVLVGTTKQHVIDLAEDADIVPHDLGHGAYLAEGALRRAQGAWNALSGVFNPDASVRFEGHSAGGWSTLAIPVIVPEHLIDALIAWAPPKVANDNYYDLLISGLDVTVVINGADMWAAWPWGAADLQHPPGDILWLDGNSWAWKPRDQIRGSIIGGWGDHDEGEYLAKIKALAA